MHISVSKTLAGASFNECGYAEDEEGWKVAVGRDVERSVVVVMSLSGAVGSNQSPPLTQEILIRTLKDYQ